MSLNECNKPSLNDLLPDYYSGHLSESLRTEVASHLKDCDSCRQDLRFMEIIGGPAQVDPPVSAGDHPTSAQIGRYFRNDSSLAAVDRETIEAHISKCEQCAYDLHFLQSSELELRRSVQSSDQPATAWSRVFSVSARLVRSPALAYFILVLLAYPSAKWLLHSGDESPDSSGDVYELGYATRGDGDMVKVERRRLAPLIKFALPTLYDSSLVCHSVVVTRASDNAPEMVSAIVIEGRGRQLVLMDSRTLVDGTYVLRIRDFPCDSARDTLESAYLFDLQTR